MRRDARPAADPAHGAEALERARLGDPPTLRVLIFGPMGFVWAAIRDSIESDDIAVVGQPSAAVDVGTLLAAKPDVVLVDADAIGDGWPEQVREACRALPSAVVVVLAPSRSEDAVARAVEAGALGYITRDVTSEALRRSIDGIRRGELAMSRSVAAVALAALQRRVESTSGMARVPDGGLSALTSREREVLALIAEGLTDREVAARLSISVRTVESHVSQIRRRLGVRGRAQAAMRYLRAVEETRARAARG